MKSSVYTIGILLALLTSCRVAERYTREDQALLVRQQVEGNQEIGSAALSDLYRQESNRRVLGMLPQVGVYRFGERFFDSTRVARRLERLEAKYDERIAKRDPSSSVARRLEQRKETRTDKLRRTLREGNWIMRVPGEAPIIFEPEQAERTANQMRSYLESKGFFTADVDYALDTLDERQVGVRYQVREDAPYRLHRITYETDNAGIREQLEQTANERQLRPGDRYDEALFSAERERIDRRLRNQGYYGFNRQFVTYVADTAVRDSALGDRLVDVRTLISNPKAGPHQRYVFDKVYFTLDAETGRENFVRDTIEYRGVHYIARNERIPANTLDRKMQIRSGLLYRLSEAINTQGQLSSLDIFRFVNLSIDTVGDKLTGNLTASMLPRYQISDEVGLLVSQGAPGPFANASFKVRNFLGGFEIFEVSARYSDEGQFNSFTRDTAIFRAQEIGGTVSLLVPTFLFPTRINRVFDRFNPRTRFTVGYTDIRRPEYSRSITNGNMSYLFNIDQFNLLTVSPIDLNVTNTRQLDPQFEEFLLELERRGNQLIRSFDRALVTSTSASYTFNNNPRGENKRYVFFKAFAEVGGLVPSLISQEFMNDTSGQVGRLKYFQFYKVNTDFRYYYPLGRRTVLANRLHVGVAVPFGQTTTLPYEKFFFAGGSNSIRAYRPRRLGPGSFSAADDADIPSFLFEQPGDILLEASVELRQKLFSVFEGAFFVDAGNVWAIRADPSRPGATFNWDTFYNEIAIGTGVGLRLDLSFLILRLDLGIRAYDPARPPGQRYVLNQFTFRDNNTFALQIGIGYPF